eukprot:TRINITY_DN54710_c0_g1_i1.p1 TRINITY_DN54710_c0_g1~~TRINITY_DN54710_c0_g1_i1.p1  ORF type:complete len:393 (+),score=52.19 TRINITY_DN54710_c0_g1_i1:115-1293(+)
MCAARRWSNPSLHTAESPDKPLPPNGLYWAWFTLHAGISKERLVCGRPVAMCRRLSEWPDGSQQWPRCRVCLPDSAIPSVKTGVAGGDRPRRGPTKRSDLAARRGYSSWGEVRLCSGQRCLPDTRLDEDEHAMRRDQPLPLYGLFKRKTDCTVHIAFTTTDLLCGLPAEGCWRMDDWPHEDAQRCRTCNSHWRKFAREANLLQLAAKYDWSDEKLMEVREGIRKEDVPRPDRRAVVVRNNGYPMAGSSAALRPDFSGTWTCVGLEGDHYSLLGDMQLSYFELLAVSAVSYGVGRLSAEVCQAFNYFNIRIFGIPQDFTQEFVVDSGELTAWGPKGAVQITPTWMDEATLRLQQVPEAMPPFELQISLRGDQLVLKVIADTGKAAFWLLSRKT